MTTSQTEHRNGCTGCDHPADTYPPCWSMEQIFDDQEQQAATDEAPCPACGGMAPVADGVFLRHAPTQEGVDECAQSGCTVPEHADAIRQEAADLVNDHIPPGLILCRDRMSLISAIAERLAASRKPQPGDRARTEVGIGEVVSIHSTDPDYLDVNIDGEERNPWIIRADTVTVIDHPAASGDTTEQADRAIADGIAQYWGYDDADAAVRGGESNADLAHYASIAIEAVRKLGLLADGRDRARIEKAKALANEFIDEHAISDPASDAMLAIIAALTSPEETQ